jgi:Glycosyl transferases group 1/Glycosyl transferase family 2
VFVHHRCVTTAGLHFDESLRRCVDWDFIRRACLTEPPIYVPIIGCNYIDTALERGRITTGELPGDAFRLSAAQSDFTENVVGTPSDEAPAFSVVWPVLPRDDPSFVYDLWRAVWHLSTSRHELIVVNNNLDDETTSILNEIALRTRRFRVVNLWHSFMRYPAANVGASLADGRVLVFWRGGVEYDADAVDRLAETAGAGNEADSISVACPALVDANGRLSSQIAEVGTDTAILLPILHQVPAARAAVRISGIVAQSFPIAIRRDVFTRTGGFDYDFAVSYGVADLCLRLLSVSPEATRFEGSVAVRETSPEVDADSRTHVMREWEHLRQQWLGRLSRRATFPATVQFEEARVRGYELIGWALRPTRTAGVIRLKSEGRAVRAVGIHCPAPAGPAGSAWGDRYFAEALASAITRQGRHAFIRYRDQWGVPIGRLDTVIHLRGIVRVEPIPGVVNVLWIISHPDTIESAEVASMDLVLAASAGVAGEVRRRFGLDCVVVPQATDPCRFKPTTANERLPIADQFLFVGNSRRQPRPIVLDAVLINLPLQVYGEDWERYIASRFIRGARVPNEQLGRWYAAARGVLNDHWPSMRDYGIISNRLYDVVASGGVAISDRVAGVEELFDGQVRTYEGIAELRELASHVEDWAPPPGRRLETARRIGTAHSFEARAKQLLSLLD